MRPGACEERGDQCRKRNIGIGVVAEGHLTIAGSNGVPQIDGSLRNAEVGVREDDT